MEQLALEEAAGVRIVSGLMGVFGLCALVLASIGVYGVMSYTVTTQTQEIGIRMALGARRSNVMTMLFRNGLVPAVGGVAMGLVLSMGLARVLANLFFGVSATDALTFAGTAFVLLASGIVAIYIPAQRAARVDPIIALRYE